MASKHPRSLKWRQPFTLLEKTEGREAKTKVTTDDRGEGTMPTPASRLFEAGTGAKREKSSGGRRKSLKKLDSRKTNAWISFRFFFDFLPAFLGFPSA
jgi:hypothetical protein